MAYDLWRVQPTGSYYVIQWLAKFNIIKYWPVCSYKIDYGKQSVIKDDSDDDHVGSYYGNYNYGATVSEVEFIKWCEDVSHI